MTAASDPSDGTVVIWWSVKVLAGSEKAGEGIEALAGELRTADDWRGLRSRLGKVRPMKSSNL